MIVGEVARGRSEPRQLDIEAASYCKALPCNKALDHGYVDQTERRSESPDFKAVRAAETLRALDHARGHSAIRGPRGSARKLQAGGGGVLVGISGNWHAHLTGEETRAWLRTWGTDAETEAPPCHD